MNLTELIKILQKSCVGERLPLMAIILTITGRKCINKDPKNTNLHADDQAGIGKDYIIDVIKKYLWPECWRHFVMPSPAAITNTQIKQGDPPVVPEPITSNTIIYIEDADDCFINSRHFKLLINGEVKDFPLLDQGSWKTVSWNKPVVIISTATGCGDNQIVRRLPSLKYDNSVEQTERIKKFTIQKACVDGFGHLTNDDKLLINQHLNSLKYVYVDLSDVRGKIESEIREQNELEIRSLLNRLIDITRFSATFHQNDRKRIKNEGKQADKVFANEEDVNHAIEIVHYMYKPESEAIYNPLNHRQRDIAKRIEESGNWVTIDQINGWPESGDVSKVTLYKDLKKIQQRLDHINCTGSFPIRYGVGDPTTEENNND